MDEDPLVSPDEPAAWDWSTPFDDDFVRAAAVREASGQERAVRALRIAAQHEHLTPWRAPGPAAPRAPRSGNGRALVGALLTVVLVIGAGLLLDRLGWITGTALDVTAGTGVDVPVPADAAPDRLLPAARPPRGEGGYRLLHEDRGRPVGFDPCRPVHWTLRRAGAPPDADALLGPVFAQLSLATGLSFVRDADTDEAPSPDRALVQRRYGDRYAPVLVAWSDEEESPGLEGDVAGHAGPVVVDPDRRGLRIVSGQVVLDVDTEPGGGPASPVVLQHVLLHELGHLVGLDHVDDELETMHPSTLVPGGFSPGTLRGLAAVGGGPCFT